MRNKIVLPILFAVFIAGAIFAGYKVFSTLHSYDEGENAYDSLRENVSTSKKEEPSKNPIFVFGENGIISKEEADAMDKEDKAEDTETTDEPEEEDPHAGIDFPEVDFDALLAMNSDIVGWIYMEDSPIDYPVVRGRDNNQYIRTLPDGNYNSAGSIFMDYKNSRDFQDMHTVIYGHRMNNGSMFGTVVNYENQSWYDEHPRCLLMTPDGNHVVEFFAGYVAKLDEEAWKLTFGSDEEFAAWINAAIARSTFESDIVPEAGERVITLSTCTKTNGYLRYVLLGVLR